MPIPRLTTDDTALLVIDVQERLLPTIADRQKLTTNCAILLQMAGVLGLPYLVTEQYPTGLGRTADEVTAAMPDPSRRIEKTRFSAVIDLVEEQLQSWRCANVLICGIEAHVCVLQTVLDLQAGQRAKREDECNRRTHIGAVGQDHGVVPPPIALSSSIVARRPAVDSSSRRSSAPSVTRWVSTWVSHNASRMVGIAGELPS